MDDPRSRRASKDIWMRTEEASKAQEDIHSADQGTEPDLIPSKSTRTPNQTYRHRMRPFAPLSRPTVTISIQSHSTVPVRTHSNSIAPNLTQLHLSSDARSPQTMYMNSGQSRPRRKISAVRRSNRRDGVSDLRLEDIACARFVLCTGLPSFTWC